jgi:ABC-type multidrug transport system fused ATPase/permease subunit
VCSGLIAPTMADTSEGTGNRPERPTDFLSLLKIAGVSWSLLTAKEKSFFLIRVGVRLALNGLDIVAVALMGLLGAITATGLSGQNLEIFGYQIPSPTATNVIVLVALVALLFILKGGLAIIFQRWTSIFLAGVEIKNSAKVTRYLFSGSLQRLKRYSRAEITFLVQSSTNATFSGVLGSMTTLVIESTLFLSIFVIFLLVDPWAALAIALYFTLLVLLLQATTAKRFLASGNNLRKGSVDTGGSILEMVDGFREIAVLSKQDFFLTRFIEAKKLSARTGVTLQILKSLPRYIAETGLIVGALGFTVWQLSQGTLAEGLFALGVFLAGSFRMMGAILPLQAIWNELRIMQISVEMAQEILVRLRDTPELLDADIFSDTGRLPTPTNAHQGQGGLPVELKNVVFHHVGASSPALRKVSLDIASGAYVAIVGPSGAGKTTLVDLLLGLYDPDKGSVRVGGEDPRALRENSPGLLSYVPQRPGLVSGSLANNVALGVPDDEIDEDAVRESLRKAQLLAFVDTLPEGIHSSLGPHADSLSGGQIQRLGFARALYTKPQLIILDEATSALDAATEASVASSIKNVGGETTVIVIAHRLSTIQDADQVHVMDAGKIIASGTFSEIRKAVPMVEEYVQLMSFRDE